MPLNRRELLSALLAAGGGVTLGAVGLPRVIETTRPARGGKWGLPKEALTLSVCGGCPAACSMRVRTVGGNAVGVSGNPLCPIGRGGLCARGAAQVEAVYDPDRLVGPVHRAHKGEDADWQAFTWDDATAAVVTKLQELQRAGRQHRVAIVLPAGSGLAHDVARVFLRQLGSPHFYTVNSLRDPAATASADLSMGLGAAWCYDLGQADHVMAFGSPILEGWLSPAWVSRVFGKGRERGRSRLDLVVVSSRLSETAAHADRWVPVKAGTEPVLALGLAHLLQREHRIDQDFVSKWVAGFDDWQDGAAHHRGLNELLRYAYTPQMVSDATGVSVPTLHSLVRGFAAAKRPLAIGEKLGATAGVFGLGAINALNVLTGRVMQTGGILPSRAAPTGPIVDAANAPALPSGSLVGPEHAPVRGVALWPALAALTDGKGEPPFDMLFIFDGSVLDAASPAAIAAIRRIPTVVSFATGLDASTSVADIVLPAPTNLEQANDVEPPPFDGRSYLAVSAAAMEPLLDTRPIVDTLLKLSAKVDGKDGGGLPAGISAAKLTRRRLDGLFAARRGLPYSSEFEEDWTRQMEEAGLWESTLHKSKDFARAVYQGGGWVDPVVHYGNPGAALLHSDRRYHLHGAGARRRAAELAMAYPVDDTDDAWLPHPEGTHEAGGTTTEFDLIPYRPRAMFGSGTPNLPSLFEQAGPVRNGAYSPWIELNPADAENLGFQQGDNARVVSDHGAVNVSVHRHPGIQPGTVAMPLMPVGDDAGRWAQKWTGGASDLLGPAAAVLVGSRLVAGTRVRIEAISGEPS
ncbi:MAG: molybdopterin-dependent oxidoreductase [Oligoflexia bacterium]|nr:molybdopterin-dependent oxidoreductase [Oligoflexia bacterium]